jgi:hypothetical protein
MRITLQQLNTSLYEDIVAPELNKFSSNKHLLLHELSPEDFIEKSIHIRNSNDLTKENSPNLIAALKKYNAIQKFIVELNLPESNALYFELSILFANFNQSKPTLADIEKLFTFLNRSTIQKVCTLAATLKTYQLLAANYFFVCLENSIHASKLLETFHYLSGPDYSSLGLLNDRTLTLFEKAPHSATSISNLLFILWENKIYRPNDKINFNKKNAENALIDNIFQYITNIDHTLFRLRKLTERKKPITEEIVRHSLSHQHSAAFDMIIDLIDEKEATLETLQTVIDEFHARIENALKPNIAKLQQERANIIQNASSQYIQNAISSEEWERVMERLSSLTALENNQSHQINTLSKILTQLHPSENIAVEFLATKNNQNKMTFFSNPLLPNNQLNHSTSRRRNSI